MLGLWGGEGHLKFKCPDLWKTNNDTKKAQESSKPDKEATVSVVEIISDEEGAWAAEEELVVAGKDWFEEVATEEMEKLKEVEGERTELFGDMSGKAFIVAESVQVLNVKSATHPDRDKQATSGMC